MIRRLRVLGVGAALLLAGLLATGCGQDACAVLVIESCGSDDACAEDAPCLRARDMALREVVEACEAARANEVSFPDCRL